MTPFGVIAISVASNGTPICNVRVHISYLYILFDHYKHAFEFFMYEREVKS